jgi:hypothetical protein
MTNPYAPPAADALPERLGAELVNRYHAVKRSARF